MADSVPAGSVESLTASNEAFDELIHQPVPKTPAPEVAAKEFAFSQPPSFDKLSECSFDSKEITRSYSPPEEELYSI